MFMNVFGFGLKTERNPKCLTISGLLNPFFPQLNVSLFLVLLKINELANYYFLNSLQMKFPQNETKFVNSRFIAILGTQIQISKNRAQVCSYVKSRFFPSNGEFQEAIFFPAAHDTSLSGNETCR